MKNSDKHLWDDPLWAKVVRSITPLKRRSMPPRPQGDRLKGDMLAGDAPAGGKTNRSPQNPPAKTDEKPSPPSSVKAGASKPPPSTKTPSTKIASRPPLIPADLDTPGYGGIAQRQARMMKKGRLRPTGRLDLHGAGRDQARLRLEAFLIDSSHQGHRLVLVITGKGVAGTGIIRRNLPHWLTTPPLAGLVIAYCQAQPKDGGAGAFYVSLRVRENA